MKGDGSYQLPLPGFEHRLKAVGGKVLKKLDTPENRDYWRFVEETAARVREERRTREW